MGGASLVGGYLSGQAAKSAAETQANAQLAAAQQQREMFNVTNEQQAPYREAGYAALKDIAGMKPYLQQQYGPEEFAATIDPSYAFRLQQGQLATRNAANQAGGLIGGNALKGMEDYTQGLASTEYNNAFNRFQTQRTNIYNTLASIAGLGQTSLGQTTAAGTTTGANIGQNIANAGAAQAAGTVGAANALSGGLQGAGNAYSLSNILGGRNNAGTAAWTNPAFDISQYANAAGVNFTAPNVYG